MVDDEKILKDIGSRFKKARELANLKQTDVATAAGLNANYYAQIERGEVNLSIKKVQQIAKVLKIKSIDL